MERGWLEKSRSFIFGAPLPINNIYVCVTP